MKRILIIDDHAVVRGGLKQILLDEFPNTKFGEANNSGEALEFLNKEDWDVVILDISLPGRSGLDILKDTKQAKPKLPILVYSMHSEEEFAIRALKSGASGYMSKSELPDQLVKAIHQLLTGRKYISSSLAERLAVEIEKPSEKPLHEILSNREHQVMLMIASGNSPTQIAEELSLSIKTISSYRARILDKMRMKTNAEIIRYSIENKLI
ncbi:MAG: response regulator transcription factor [Bacteroidota bacterium]|nr:response regulator transcription factor [Bacteroidota bacterium]